MIDPHNRPVLKDGTLRLRAPVSEDVDARFSLGLTPEILHMFGADPTLIKPYTCAMAQDWIDAQMQEPLAFIIEHKGRLIGALRLHSVVPHDKRASLAVGLLDPDLLGKGIGTQACRLILDHAFSTLDLHRITLRVIDYNARAIAAYEKLGFQHEGREREAACVGDTYHDDLIMGLLASEWQA